MLSNIILSELRNSESIINNCIDLDLADPGLAIRRGWGPEGVPSAARDDVQGRAAAPAARFGGPGPHGTFQGPQKRSSSPAFARMHRGKAARPHS